MEQIDASYLSPHVNMASRLEAATKQYGVDILFSEDFFGLLSPKIQDLCRYIYIIGHFIQFCIPHNI
jgi:class 3 adenylate cyclase